MKSNEGIGRSSLCRRNLLQDTRILSMVAQLMQRLNYMLDDRVFGTETEVPLFALLILTVSHPHPPVWWVLMAVAAV